VAKLFVLFTERKHILTQRKLTPFIAM